MISTSSIYFEANQLLKELINNIDLLNNASASNQNNSGIYHISHEFIDIIREHNNFFKELGFEVEHNVDVNSKSINMKYTSKDTVNISDRQLSELIEIIYNDINSFEFYIEKSCVVIEYVIRNCIEKG